MSSKMRREAIHARDQHLRVRIAALALLSIWWMHTLLLLPVSYAFGPHLGRPWDSNEYFDPRRRHQASRYRRRRRRRQRDEEDDEAGRLVSTVDDVVPRGSFTISFMVAQSLDASHEERSSKSAASASNATKTTSPALSPSPRVFVASGDRFLSGKTKKSKPNDGSHVFVASGDGNPLPLKSPLPSMRPLQHQHKNATFTASLLDDNDFPSGTTLLENSDHAFAGEYADNYTEPSILSSLPVLLSLTRPSNFPGILLMHILGTYLAVDSTAAFSWQLLRHPAMLLTLLALFITSSTSMVVNDYYDAKLGRDANKNKALVNGDVTLPVAKRFLSLLYGVALLATAFLPGIPTRMAVVSGLMLTYWYTQHLKPITWLKNVVCASLIALAPFASGSTALHLQHTNSWYVLSNTRLWRLVAIMFFGVLGREITMDCNDVVYDRQARVRTVPVHYGRHFAARVALATQVLVMLLAVGGPVLQVTAAWPTEMTAAASTTSSWIGAVRSVTAAAPGAIRRCGLAVAGSVLQIVNAVAVANKEGCDEATNNRAVEQGFIGMVLVLASFV